MKHFLCVSAVTLVACGAMFGTGPHVPGSYQGTTPSINFWVLGASYDLNQRLTFALDWQKQTGTNYPSPTGTNVRAPADASNVFLHFQASF